MHNGHLQIKLFDMDTDGDLDIVVGSADDIWWWENPLTASSGASKSMPSAPVAPMPSIAFPSDWPLHRLGITTNLRPLIGALGGALVFLDVDFDNLKDLVILPEFDLSQDIMWHKNFGNGRWDVPGEVLFNFHSTYDGKKCWLVVTLAVIDADVDGTEDLFMGCQSGESVWIPLGGRERSAPLPVPLLWNGTGDYRVNAATAGDIDGDGIDDLVCIRISLNFLYIFFQNTI